MLCRIIYPGHTVTGDTTRLAYNSNGHLARILDPGGEMTTLGYDAAGNLSQIVDSLANDWLSANPTAAVGVAQQTTIAYDTSGRAIAVTLPAPDGVTIADRPSKSFTYGTGTTTVDVAGLDLDERMSTRGLLRTPTRSPVRARERSRPLRQTRRARRWWPRARSRASPSAATTR